MADKFIDLKNYDFLAVTVKKMMMNTLLPV